MAHGDNIYDPGSLSLNHYVGPPFGYASCTHNPMPFATGPNAPGPGSPLDHRLPSFSTLGTTRKPPGLPRSFSFSPSPAVPSFLADMYVFHGPGSDSSTVTRAVNQTTLTFNAGKLHAK